VSFSNSLNMKKILSFTFFGLVKRLNDIGLVVVMRPSYSFIGLIKITRMDLYYKHMLSLTILSKSNLGTRQKWWGKIGSISSVVFFT